MRNLLIMMVAALVMTACNTQTKTSEKESSAQEALGAEWVEVVLNVDGMTCEGCENAIKAGVESLDGIASCESSFEEGWTRVKYDKTLTSLEDIEGKITETGYVVEGEKTSVNL